MRSGVPDHEYSFSLEEAEAWLATHLEMTPHLSVVLF